MGKHSYRGAAKGAKGVQQVASSSTHHFTLIVTEVEIETSGATANVLSALEKLRKSENWWVLIPS